MRRKHKHHCRSRRRRHARQDAMIVLKIVSKAVAILGTIVAIADVVHRW
jgi:hypothetical protein